MVKKRKPGPLCVTRNPVNINDGTLCRSLSPKPGPTIGVNEPTPGILDHLHSTLGGAAGPMNEEAWFEDRYPNWMNHARDTFIKEINTWVYNNWRSPDFKGPAKRLNVYSRGEHRNDDKFKKQGDKPQSPHEADKVLGSFSIDIDTPVKIKYSTISKSGRQFDLNSWKTVMYVEDVLGLQKYDPIYNEFTGWLFPSRRVKRARWEIKGEQMSYVIKTGDTLSKIAHDLYGHVNLWKRIHDANKALIPNENLIHPGMRLKIPKP